MKMQGNKKIGKTEPKLSMRGLRMEKEFVISKKIHTFAGPIKYGNGSQQTQY